MENDDLSLYLSALARDGSYRVAETLKRTPHETTEVVFFTGAQGGELGPFVRKRINRESGLGEAYRSLFEAQREGKRFRHLPRIYDVHERDEKLVVIMEYVTGRTLQDEVSEHGENVPSILAFFPVLCDGVTELHEGIYPPLIHRDLKPSNIMISNGNLTIIDFGIARAYRDGATNDTTPFGTRAYAPPEQFGFRQTDVQSDVYALGMILFYLLAGEDPKPESLQSGFPELAAVPSLQAVVAKATSFDPAARYRSAAELKQAFLQAVATSLPAPVTPPVVPAQSPTTQPVSQPQIITLSEALGLVWNIIVVIIWAFFIAAMFFALFDQSESLKAYPLWLKVLIYPLACGTFFTGAAYGLMDKRVLRRRFPLLRGQTYGKSVIVALIIMGCALAALLALVVVAAFVTA